MSNEKKPIAYTNLSEQNDLWSISDSRIGGISEIAKIERVQPQVQHSQIEGDIHDDIEEDGCGIRRKTNEEDNDSQMPFDVDEQEAMKNIDETKFKTE